MTRHEKPSIPQGENTQTPHEIGEMNENLGDVVGGIANAASQVFMDMLKNDPRVPTVPDRTEFLTTAAMEAMGKMLGEEGLEVTDIREFARQIDPTIPTVEQEEELRERAETDMATGFLNKHEFYERCKKEKIIAVILIDGTNFGATNKSDGMTHRDGDEAIQIMSSAIKENTREEDIVGRIGNGDEFAIALTAPEFTHDNEQKRRPIQQIPEEEVDSALAIKQIEITELFNRLMRDPKNSKFTNMQYPSKVNEAGEVEEYTTLSLGIDISPVVLHEGESVEDAIARASENMQEIKNTSHAKLGHAPKIPNA